MLDKKLNILIVSDGKKGHEDTSYSIAKGFQDIFNDSVSLSKLNIKIRLKLLLKLLNALLRIPILKNFFFRNNIFINLFYKKSLKSINFNEIDYVISAGGDTVYYNIFLAERFNLKNIYTSRLKNISTDNFYLIISTFEKNLSKNTIYLDFPPLEKKEIETVFEFDNVTKLNKKIASLLIGGDGAGYKYSAEDYGSLISNYIQFLEKNDLYGLITTSRRTSKYNDLIIKNIINTLDKNNRIKYSIFFNIVPEYLLGNYLIKSNYLFVTEDSGSMITESILTNKPVYTVRPSKFKIEKLYDAFINKISVYLSGRIQINEIQNIDLKYVKNNNIKSPYEVFKLKLKKYLEEN